MALKPGGQYHKVAAMQTSVQQRAAGCMSSAASRAEAHLLLFGFDVQAPARSVATNRLVKAQFSTSG